MSWHDYRGHHDGSLSRQGRSNRKVAILFDELRNELDTIIAVPNARLEPVPAHMVDKHYVFENNTHYMIEDLYLIATQLNKAGYHCDILDIPSVNAAFQKLITTDVKQGCGFTQRYYPNDIYNRPYPGTCNMVKLHDLPGHIWYNIFMRPGTALIVNRVCIKTGIGLGYKDIEKLMEYQPDLSKHYFTHQLYI